jgi:hypothetical protein
MEMASFCLKIRHVFADTSLTERSIGAGPPVIIQLSGDAWLLWLALVSIYQTDVTSFSKMEEVLNGYVTNPNGETLPLL